MVKKTKAKQWIKILAPSMFGNREIGHTLSSEPEKIIGRRITVSAIDVLNDYNKYYLKLSFKIKEFKDNKAISEFDGFECTRDYIARMVVRRVRRIDSVVDVETKDHRRLRVKMIIVTRKKIKKVAEKEMRKMVNKIIVDQLGSDTFVNAVKKLISDKFKDQVQEKLRKIYPIRYFEFRKLEVLK